MKNLSYSNRFKHLLITQFLGAFNDNVFKNALMILITFSLVSSSNDAHMYVLIAGGIFVLPYFIFSSTTGQFSDKFAKHTVIKYTKLLEIFIMIIALVALLLMNIYLLLFVLFLLGSQSALFGPAKYAVLPELLDDNELVKGNGHINSLTFLAILFGTIFGGEVVMLSYGPELVGLFAIVFAVIGYCASLKIPQLQAKEPTLKIDWNIFKTTYQLMKYAMSQKSCDKNDFNKSNISLIILGVSWFWFIGASYLTQLAPFAKEVLLGSERIVTLLLTSFALGIGLGSLLCARLLKSYPHATFVPLSALLMSIFGIDLYYASNAIINEPQLSAMSNIGLIEFFSSFKHIRVFFDFMMLAISAGLYFVPLETMLQSRSPEDKRARIIAATNIMNALFMVLSACFLVVLSMMGLTIPQTFLVISIIGIFASVIMCKILPSSLIRSIVHLLLKILFRVDVQGLDNLTKVGNKSIIIANHTSFIDALLLSAFLPVPQIYAANTQIAEKWWMRPVRLFGRIHKVDPTNPMSIKQMIAEVKDGGHLVIFPEGRITVTGALMKVYEGPGLIASKTGAPIVPVQITGAKYTIFSKLKHVQPRKYFPKVSLSIMEPINLEINRTSSPRDKRKLVSEQLYKLMSDMTFYAEQNNQTILEKIIDARKIHGYKKQILEDINFKPIHYGRLLTGTYSLGRYFKKHISQSNPYVGLLLPNTNAAVVTFLGLQKAGFTPANLNFSSGISCVLSCCKATDLKFVITSRVFIDKGGLSALVDEMVNKGLTIIYLEDVADNISIITKLLSLMQARFNAVNTLMNLCMKQRIQSSDAAVVLFTSGSEGLPKGVVLSHDNVISNCAQVGARVDFNSEDKVFNVLPMFHSFGLTAGTLLPLMNGLKVFMYPSPLHYRVVPELVYSTDSTILFGTDSFLSSYASNANPYDFYSLRYVFAGAEKLKDRTRSIYSEKFGVRIFEGYGATEAAPIIAVNTPMFNKPGTVGKLLPNIEYKLDKVEGVDYEIGRGVYQGRLWVKGPNIMMGYLRAENSDKQIEVVPDGWYDTGDIVKIEDGYLQLMGRAKRFAKIAGEMVSLSAVEESLEQIWEDSLVAVIAQSDDKKGEKLIALTNYEKADRKDIVKHMKANKLSELMIPKEVVVIDDLPLLGSGKIDYVSLNQKYNQ